MSNQVAVRSGVGGAVEGEARIRVGKFLLRAWAVLSFAIFGSIFFAYATQNPAWDYGGSMHWTVWDGLPGHVALMLSGIYLVWAVFVLIAVRKPAAWGSFFTFTLVVNVIHAAIMVPGAFEAPYHSKFATDIPWILLLSLGIYLLRPATRILEPDR